MVVSQKCFKDDYSDCICELRAVEICCLDCSTSF